MWTAQLQELKLIMWIFYLSTFFLHVFVGKAKPAIKYFQFGLLPFHLEILIFISLASFQFDEANIPKLFLCMEFNEMSFVSGLNTRCPAFALGLWVFIDDIVSFLIKDCVLHCIAFLPLRRSCKEMWYTAIDTKSRLSLCKAFILRRYKINKREYKITTRDLYRRAFFGLQFPNMLWS